MELMRLHVNAYSIANGTALLNYSLWKEKAQTCFGKQGSLSAVAEGSKQKNSACNS